MLFILKKLWRITMAFAQVYQEKLTKAEDAISLVRNGDTIIVPTGAAEPPKLLTALAEQRLNFLDLKISQILSLKKYGFFDPATVHHIRHVSYFFGPASRPGGQEGWSDYMPANFSEVPSLIRRGWTSADVLFSLASPMDEEGFFSLSLAVDYSMASIEKARVVVLEVNPNVPYCFGSNRVHISQVTALIESEDPIAEVGLPKIGPVQEAIGKYVADMVNDGDTLQIGYGGIPDAVVMQLTNKRDLGIHTEMIGDGILMLVEAGSVNNKLKNINTGKMFATFALGSKKLYQWMHRHPMLEMHPVDITNDPYLAGQINNLVSINATMQIDFIGQCGSETLGHSPISGTGGQTDFVRAANRSEGGKSFIVLPSTAKNDTISRIVPSLSSGTHVSTSKNDINYVVTEYGVAQLRGKSAKQRAEALIKVAHPKFRDQLKEQSQQIFSLQK